MRHGNYSTCNVTPLETHNLAANYADKVKILSSAYEAFAKQTMVLYAKGKLIDYVGIDSKTGRYLAVDPQTLQPVPAPLAIPLDYKIGPIIIGYVSN
ncbi:hypothetical protein LFZ31_19835, partial [Salmonella enterica subsp. enterica serovar Newport str. S09097]